MTTETGCALPDGRCADQAFRLSVYEAGHALTARALGLKILYVRMLPRPPVLVSDKTFVGNNWESFIKTLENRVIELFGGQIAEELLCDATTCCTGDIPRIDELTRMIAGLGEVEDMDSVWFELEDIAQRIFADPQYRAAILPVAEYLHARELDGHDEIDGAEIEAVLDRHVPPLPKETKFKRLLSFVGQ